MARSHQEKRNYDADGTALWATTLEVLSDADFRVEPDRDRWTISAKPSLLSTAVTGSVIMTIKVYDGQVDVHSESWPKTVLVDYGKNRRSVNQLLDGISRSLTRHRNGSAQFMPPPPTSRPTVQSASPSTIHPPPPKRSGVPAAAAAPVCTIETTETVLEVIDIDEFPVDNIHGCSPLVLEQEFSHSETVGVRIDSELQVQGKVSATILKMVSAEVSAHAKRSHGIEGTKTITRTHKSTFTVGPGQRTMYRITWRRRRHDGHVVVDSSGQIERVPFSVVTDLEYGVSTHKLETVS